MKLKTFTTEDIHSWGLPLKFPEGWSGTALDILKIKDLRVNDKFWVVLREEALPEKLLRLFTVWCIRQVQHIMKDEKRGKSNEINVKIIDIAEKYANGEASKENLIAVMGTRDAAVFSANVAEGDASWGAVSKLVGDDLFGAAWFEANYTAGYAAREAAEDAQLKKLIEMIKDNSDEAL